MSKPVCGSAIHREDKQGSQQSRIKTGSYASGWMKGVSKKDPSAEMEGQVLLKHTLGQCEAFEGILQTAAVRQDMKQCVKTRAI